MGEGGESVDCPFKRRLEAAVALEMESGQGERGDEEKSERMHGWVRLVSSTRRA